MTWLATAAPGAGEEVHVDVVDDLPALWPAMHSEPVAALGEALRLAQRSGRKEAAAQHFDVASLHRHDRWDVAPRNDQEVDGDRKSTRLNSSHDQISYAVFCLK